MASRFCCVISMVLTAVWVPAGQAQEVSFARQVLPILSNKCFVCHGPDSSDPDQLRLDSYAGATMDRHGQQAIDPDSPAESLILTRIHSTDDPMPPQDAEKQLTASERNILDRWVRQGGAYAQHWAFVVPEKSPPPQGSTNPVDAFIGSQLKDRGIDFAPEADRATLARRVALVLTGLPPEPAQLSRFLKASDMDAGYLELVDDLLASPRFGEHQARYWLDAVRYGDTHGLHLDNRRGIYPYRDWVVRACNENLPLDEFITYQLAGDLLPDPSLSQLVATGYVRLNPSTGEGGAIPAEFQMKNNFDRVETLGTVFLGLSLTCARCHTHKYDPIPQTEYYRLLAFFNSTAEPAMDGNKYEYGPTVKVPPNHEAWQQWTLLEEERDALIELASQKINASDSFSQQAVKQWNEATARQKLQLLADANSPFAELNLASKASQFVARTAEAEAAFTTSLIARDLNDPRTTHVLHRGEYDQPIGEPLTPGIVSVTGEFPEGLPRNRSGLAKWLTSRRNPLVPRVLVNRIWQRTMGDGLVRTPEDFGLQGQQPTHPELLDWLAVDLQDNHWNVKQLLRLLVSSRTFRQDSARRKDVDDPENRLYARAASYRLDAEVLRDVGLWASGLLDPFMGGEGVKPYQPTGMWLALAHPGSNTKNYVADKGQLLYRRSLYVYWKRTSPHPMMTLFDAPDRESSCVRRSRTNTSLQSLGLLNEVQRIEMSRKLAERILRAATDDEIRLEQLYLLLTCRGPTEIERAACIRLLQTMRQKYNDRKEDAVGLLAIGEAKPDETLNAVDVAAWSQVITTVLASDAAILLY